MYLKHCSAGCMLAIFALSQSSSAQVPNANPPRTFTFLGFPTQLLISGAETANASALLDMQIPSKAGPPAHIHSREDEVYFIKKGTFQFLMDGVCLQAGPGTSVYMPKGHFHTFKNISAQTGEQLMFVYPAGIEQFFWQVSQMTLALPQDFPKLKEAAHDYGIDLVPDHEFHAGPCKMLKPPR